MSKGPGLKFNPGGLSNQRRFLRTLIVTVMQTTVRIVITIMIMFLLSVPDRRFHGLLITGRGASGTLKHVPSVSLIRLESLTWN
jgi:ammonia channel protein AmtB